VEKKLALNRPLLMPIPDAHKTVKAGKTLPGEAFAPA
jgi:hypothetical protein